MQLDEDEKLNPAQKQGYDELVRLLAEGFGPPRTREEREARAVAAAEAEKLPEYMRFIPRDALFGSGN